MKRITLLVTIMSLFASVGMSQGWGKGMLVKAGTTVTEESGTTIYIQGGADWTLLLEDNTSTNPSFLVSGDVKFDANSDSLRFQQYITKDAWHYVSSPVSPSTSGDFLWMYLYSFNENDRTWTNIFNDNAQNLSMGTGYAAWSPTNGGSWPAAGDSMEYHGLPINTTINDYALSYAYGGTAAATGWNLVGNPYTVAMDWNGHADWDLTNVDATIYMVDQDAFAASNGYQTYNWNTGIATNGGDSIITSGQGFFIHANAAGASLDFPTSQRFHRPSKEFVKTNDGSIENLLRIALMTEKGENEMIIAFNKNTLEGNDPLFDAYHIDLNTSIGEIYATEGDNHYAHYWSPSIENHEVVPVNFEPHSNGTYKLNFSNTESFDSEIPIWLEDLKTDEWQNLRENPLYAFSATMEDDIARFNVHFAAPNAVEEIEDVNSFANIYSYEKEIHINIPMDNFSGQAFVYNMLGEEVLVKNVVSQDNVITMNEDDVYFVVKLVGNEDVITKKVYIH